MVEVTQMFLQWECCSEAEFYMEPSIVSILGLYDCCNRIFGDLNCNQQEKT